MRDTLMNATNVTWETCSFSNLEPTPFSILNVDIFVVFLTKTTCYVGFCNFEWVLALTIDIFLVLVSCTKYGNTTIACSSIGPHCNVINVCIGAIKIHNVWTFWKTLIWG